MPDTLHEIIINAILSKRPAGVMTYGGFSSPDGKVAVKGWDPVLVAELADAIIAALPAEREWPAAQDAKDDLARWMGARPFPHSIESRLAALSDRVGDLETWRGSLGPQLERAVFADIHEKDASKVGADWSEIVQRLQSQGSQFLAVHAADSTTMSGAIRRGCNFCFDLARDIQKAEDPDWYEGKIER